MNSSKPQNGSTAVVILVAVLVIVLISALGFIFWNNFINKPEPNELSLNEAQTKVEDDFKNIASEETFRTGLAIKYPDNWSYKHIFEYLDSNNMPAESNTLQDNPSGDTTKLTSPSGDIVITLHAFANGGLGGTCENVPGTLSYIERDKIANYPGVSYLAVVYQSSFMIGAATSNPRIDSVTLDSNTSCDLAYANLLETGIEIADNTPVLASLFIDFNSLRNNDLTPELIKSKLQGSEYETAKKIVQSLYKQ
jgi:hypothetical protein